MQPNRPPHNGLPQETEHATQQTPTQWSSPGDRACNPTDPHTMVFPRRQSMQPNRPPHNGLPQKKSRACNPTDPHTVVFPRRQSRACNPTEPHTTVFPRRQSRACNPTDPHTMVFPRRENRACKPTDPTPHNGLPLALHRLSLTAGFLTPRTSFLGDSDLISARRWPVLAAARWGRGRQSVRQSP